MGIHNSHTVKRNQVHLRKSEKYFSLLPLELVYDHELNIANYGYHRQMHLARVVALPDFSILLLQAIVQSAKKAKIRGKMLIWILEQLAIKRAK